MNSKHWNINFNVYSQLLIHVYKGEMGNTSLNAIKFKATYCKYKHILLLFHRQWNEDEKAKYVTQIYKY